MTPVGQTGHEAEQHVVCAVVMDDGWNAAVIVHSGETLFQAPQTQFHQKTGIFDSVLLCWAACLIVFITFHSSVPSVCADSSGRHRVDMKARFAFEHLFVSLCLFLFLAFVPQFVWFETAADEEGCRQSPGVWKQQWSVSEIELLFSVQLHPGTLLFLLKEEEKEAASSFISASRWWHQFESVSVFSVRSELKFQVWKEEKIKLNGGSVRVYYRKLQHEHTRRPSS